MNVSGRKAGDGPDWERLLRAASAPFATIKSKHLAGKRILITGSGGSIGSALAHSIRASAPGKMVLLDTSENGLYQIDRSLHEARCHQHLSILGDVCDRDRLMHLFENHRPQIVFHAAALKHVPLMEQNPFAAIANNAVGTLTLAKTAADFHAEHFVLVSTDKAADPLSIMGASKRIAELALLAIGATTDMRMIAVRLGNVAGSQGSVIPLFLDQIARHGPITVTHSDAQRYFITIDHAIEALFEALEFKSSPVILVPDLGPPVRILDLAHNLLKVYASTAPIEFTGLRPGDKMTESLLSNREHWIKSPALGRTGLRAIADTTPALAIVEGAICELSDAAQKSDLPRMLRTVAALIPEYRPSAIITTMLDQASTSVNLATHEALA